MDYKDLMEQGGEAMWHTGLGEEGHQQRSRGMSDLRDDDLVLQGGGEDFLRVGTAVDGLDPDLLEKLRKEVTKLRLENGRLRKKIAKMEADE